jgi:hypothetical protein
MSDSLDDILGPADSSPGQGGKLRELLEQALSKNKDLEAQLTQVQASQRATRLESLFDKHKIPALARDFFPTDTEPSDEAATAFVEKYGALWGVQAAAATTTPEQQAAAAQMQQLSAVAQPAPTSPLSEDEYRARFSEAKTKDDLLRMMAEFEQVAVSDLG